MMGPLYQQAKAAHQEGDSGRAASLYEAFLQATPDHAHAHYLLATLYAEGEPSRALQYVNSAIRLDPTHPAYFSLKGSLLENMGETEAAIDAYNQALSLRPESTETSLKLGKIYERRREYQRSADVCRLALSYDAQSEKLALLLIRNLLLCGQPAEALRIASIYLETTEQPLAFLESMGMAYEAMGQYEQAIEHLAQAAAISSQPRQHRIAQAEIYLKQNKGAEAARLMGPIVEDDPDCLPALLALARGLQIDDRLEEAYCYFRKAYRMAPENLAALLGIAYTAHKLKSAKCPDKLDEAEHTALRSVQQHPQHILSQFLLGEIYMARLQVKEAIHHMTLGGTGDKAPWMNQSCRIFHLNYTEDLDAATLAREHIKWADRFEAPFRDNPPQFSQSLDPDRRLRIGYVSPDFRYHPVSYFFKPVAQQHDREQFEVFAYNNLPVHKAEGFTQQIRETVDQWREIRDLTDTEVLEQIRRDQLDILVDLTGHTSDNRLMVFARRAAPLQVSWLGYPNTTGLRNMDYRFSDEWVEPAGASDEMSSETIIRLPDGFHAFVPFYDFPAVAPSPAHQRGQITFGSFNNVKKISDRCLATWAEILLRVPGSRIVLKDRSLDYPVNQQRVRSRLAALGVDPRRIVVSQMLKSNIAHLNAYSHIDIALDPFPYNGTTTTCEALYMGVPVVALAGDRHAARVSSGFLHRLGLNDLIASTTEDYIRIATRLASNPRRLLELRQSLRPRMQQSPLGDPARLTFHMEAAYRTLWQRYCEQHQPSVLTA